MKKLLAIAFCVSLLVSMVVVISSTASGSSLVSNSQVGYLKRKSKKVYKRSKHGSKYVARKTVKGTRWTAHKTKRGTKKVYYKTKTAVKN